MNKNLFLRNAGDWLRSKVRSSKKSSLENRVSEMTSSIDSALVCIESAFGGTGDKVPRLDELTRSLRANCSELLRVSGGKGDGTALLMRAAKKLELPLASIDQSISQRAKVYELMAKCEGIAQQLLERQKEMVTTLQPLKFMLVFFKIEAASLASEHQSTFKSVSDEILRLHELVDETFQSNIRNLTEACDCISSSLKNSKKTRLRFLEEIRLKQNEIEEAVKSLEKQLIENSFKDTELDDAAKKFEESIFRLVNSLQFEDILSQRFHAILSVLNDPPGNVSERALKVLLAMQFKAAVGELNHSEKEVETGLIDIGREARELKETAIGMKQFDNMTASADGMVQKLLDAFVSVSKILEGNEKLCVDAQESVEPVSRLARSLSAVVLDMSLNIQLIALNAQVRSIQVGQGSGLEVLAARTAEISSELRELGDKTSRQIQDLECYLKELSEAVEVDRCSSRELAQTVGEEGESLSVELHNMRDTAFNTLESLSSQVDEVELLVSLDCAKLGRLPEVALALGEIAKSLEEEAGLDQLSAKSRQEVDREIESHVEIARRTVHTQVEQSPSKQKDEHDETLWNPEESKKEAVPAGELELF